MGPAPPLILGIDADWLLSYRVERSGALEVIVAAPPLVPVGQRPSSATKRKRRAFDRLEHAHRESVTTLEARIRSRKSKSQPVGLPRQGDE